MVQTPPCGSTSCSPSLATVNREKKHLNLTELLFDSCHAMEVDCFQMHVDHTQYGTILGFQTILKLSYKLFICSRFSILDHHQYNVYQEITSLIPSSYSVLIQISTSCRFGQIIKIINTW